MSTTEEFDTESLLNALKNKDDRAYACLLNAYGNELLKHAYKFLRNSASAQDVLSETYLELVAHCDTIRSASALRAWLYKTVRNKSINMLKCKSAGIPVEDTSLEILVNGKHLRSGTARDIDEILHIRDCLNKLEPEERRVLFYRRDKVQWRIIAKIFDKSWMQCRTIFKNAIEKFKKFYNS